MLLCEEVTESHDRLGGRGDRIWDIEDSGSVSILSPIYHLLSPAAEAALADGVREVGDYPDFSVRYGRAMG